MKFYALNTCSLTKGINQVQILNPENIQDSINDKIKNKHYYLSVSGGSQKIDCNPCAPLYIYGAINAQMIIDENKNILFSIWTGEHKENIENKMLSDVRFENPKIGGL